MLKKPLVLFLILFFSLTGCQQFSEESLSADTVSFSEIAFEALFFPPGKEETYWVYFYSPTCRACASATELLTKRWNQHPFPLYFINIHENEIPHSSQALSNIGVNETADFSLYSTPYACFLRNRIIEKEDRGLPEIQAENQWMYFE